VFSSSSCPAPLYFAPRALQRPRPLLPGLCWPLLTSPRRSAAHPSCPFAAAHRRCSPAGAISYFWQPPRVASRPVAALVLPCCFLLRAPHCPASARALPAAATHAVGRQQLLLLAVPSPGLKDRPGIPLDFLYSFHRTALPFFSSSARVLSPELRCCLGSLSTAAPAASHPRSSAPAAPPPPTDAHRPAQFRSPALDRSDHRAGELELPPPLGLAVVQTIHCLLALAKHTTSTTSPRGRFLATSPLPSCPPATGTPSPPLRAPSFAPVRR
jgi:hypothetical protein